MAKKEKASKKQNPGSSSPKNRPKSPKNREKISLIDSGRAQNIQIVLSKLKSGKARHLSDTSKQLQKAILNVDTKILDEAKLKILCKILPTPEEVESVRSYGDDPSNDPDKLGNAEFFFLQMLTINNVKTRCELWLFTMNYSEELNEVEQRIDVFVKAQKALLKPKALKRIMEYLLAFGNYLNCKDKKKGGAFGFKLSTFDKLLMCKANDKSTLMDYLVDFVDRKDKSARDFIDELKDVCTASRMDTNSTSGDMGKMMGQYRRIKTMCDSLKDDKKENRAFRNNMQKFLDENKKRFEGNRDEIKKVMDNSKSLAEKYAEDKKTPFEELCKTFKKFIDCYIKAEEKKQKKEELREKEQKKKEWKIKQDQERKAKQKAASWAVGTTCYAKWDDDKYYDARIVRVLGNNQYHIVWPDYDDYRDVDGSSLSKYKGGKKKKKIKKVSISEGTAESQMAALAGGDSDAILMAMKRRRKKGKKSMKKPASKSYNEQPVTQYKLRSTGKRVW